MSEFLTVAMVAPCAFPANHGTPAAVKELSEALAKRGHRMEIVTYPVFDEGIPLEKVAVHRGPEIGAHV
jgi:1,2-diacylglycerol 3-alpha-glucosyltransferase